VIYTSGSTGKPKGVQIEHTSIVNQIFGLEEMYTFHSSLHHILLASFTFDPSVQQIFLPLTSGGTLFLVPTSTKHNVTELLDYIVANHIDIINTVPSLMNVLLDHINRDDGLRFQYVILAAEVFSKNLYLKLKERISVDKIINIYGPTEATINTTLHECKLEETRSTIPIGKPLINYTVMILDEHRNLLPIGIPGEIFISGVGLARGYLNNPELTAEKFAVNPFNPGERMYRTGDLASWTAEGNLEFVGRIDHQVKVRGFRVELGEIETVLLQHPRVRETVVIDQEDHASNRRLVAYVVANEEQGLTIDELRLYLKERLPDYMLPSIYMELDTLPRTTNGKVDRRALPAPSQFRQESEETVRPRSELEQQLVRIWENVLGVQPVRMKDDFFELGGSSLLAMVMFDQIEKLTGQHFPPATLAEASTVEQISRLIREDQEERPPPLSSVVTIQPGGSKPPIFLVHGADGSVLIYRDLARHIGSDQPVYGLQSVEPDMKQPYYATVEEMASHYLKELITIQPQGPYFLGGYCLGGSIALEIAQQLIAQGQEVALLVLLETYNFSNIKTRSFIDNAYYYIQKVEFHIRNFLLLKFEEKLAFIKEKAKVAKRRKNVWLGMIKMKTSSKHEFGNKQASHLYNLWKINDEAAGKYKPKEFPGKIIQIKPVKEYALYTRPGLGWDELCAGGVDIYQLPIYPAGMLVEPFVESLGEQLRACLKEAQEAI
jgi:thioesterase domain-containing protein/acyl carrier protein